MQSHDPHNFFSIQHTLDLYKSAAEGVNSEVLYDLGDRLTLLMEERNFDSNLTTDDMHAASELLVLLRNAYNDLSEDENARVLKKKLLTLTKSAFSQYLHSKTARQEHNMDDLCGLIKVNMDTQIESVSPIKNNTIDLFMKSKAGLVDFSSQNPQFGDISYTKQGYLQIDITKVSNKDDALLLAQLIKLINDTINDLKKLKEKSDYNLELSLLHALNEVYRKSSGASPSSSIVGIALKGQVSKLKMAILNITADVFKDYLPEKHNIKTMDELTRVIELKLEQEKSLYTWHKIG